MADLSWLSGEAKKIHELFQAIFYTFIGVLLLLGIVVEYFKWPLGGTPSFPILLGRTFIAIFLLHTYTDISNLFGDFADTFAKELGGFNNVHLVLAKMGEKANSLTKSWMSVKDGAMLLISFLGFFLLYISVHITEAFILYVWTLLYVFSPLLIALFVLPQTAKATSALYRSLIEVSCWKIVWAILATLVWSAALSKINDPQYNISLLSALCLNIILAGSLLLTPKIVRMLAGQGLSGIAGTVGMAAMATAMAGPIGIAKKGASIVGAGGKLGMGAANAAKGTGKAIGHFRKARAFSQEKKKLEKNPYLSSKAVTSILRKKFSARKNK